MKYFLLILMLAGSVQAAYVEQLDIGFRDSPAVDAFGNLRTTGGRLSIFDSKQLYGHDKTIFWSEVISGTATTIYTQADADVEMSVSAANDYAIRQSRGRWNYQAGKSQLILCTFHLTPSVTGMTARVGYFNSDTTAPYTNGIDGLFFEWSNGTAYVCQAKSGVITKVAQADWNIDKFDGSGPSGFTIDWSKANILGMDMEWLGIGRTRFAWVINGQILAAHAFNNANNVDEVYASSPNHSIRYEISSQGNTGTLSHICSAVMSEGGADPNGLILAHEATNVFNVLTASLNASMIAIRLQSNRIDNTTIIKGIELLAPSLGATENVKYELVYNPSFTDSFVWTDVPNSNMQIASSPSLVSTGGVVMVSGYLAGTDKQAVSVPTMELQNGVAIDGTIDVIILRATSRGSNNDDVYSILSWQELR